MLVSIVQFSGCKPFKMYAPLAQMVEQLTLNQWVLGSSPRWCTKSCFSYSKDQMWPVGQAVKTAASHAANRGSIPLRVTNKKS